MLRPSAAETLRAWLLSALVVHGAVAGNPDAKRLYDDLLSNYNKLVRPVVNTSDVLRVCIKLKLSQLIDVLSSKSEFPEGVPESIKRKNSLKNERNILSLWNRDRITVVPDDDADGGRFCYSPYDKTYEDFHSCLVECLPQKNVNQKVNKMCMPEERECSPNAIYHSLAEESTRRKDTRSCSVKSRRKSNKVNRSEGFRKKFKNVDSLKKSRKISENFRNISEEDIHDGCSKCEDSSNIVPAYFVLKLEKEAEKKPARKKSHLTANQSFKLVFAYDGVETAPEEKFENYLSSVSPLITDQCVQTVEGPSEVLEQEAKQMKTSSKGKTCISCSKIQEELKFQREFNASLLEQIKNLVGQLQSLVVQLSVNTTLMNENGGGEVRGQFSQSIWKIKDPKDEIFKANVPVIDMSCCCRTNKDLQSHYQGESGPKSSQSKKIFRKNSESTFGKVSMREFNSGFYSSKAELDQIGKKRLRRKIKSNTKYPSCCHVIHSQKNRKTGDLIEVKGKNRDKGPVRKKGNKYPETPKGEAGKIRKNDFDEDSYCDHSEEEVDDDGETTGTVEEGENPRRFNAEKKEVRQQNFLEIDYESNESEFYSKEVAVKLSSRASSRRNLKNQIMTTNLWVEQSWYDYKLRWDPKEYGGVHMLHVPSDHIWRPDIVLYNNADGNFEVTLATKATIYHQGLVEWKPPAIYKSSCEIDVEYFPFDEQTCVLKFGSWTYDGFKLLKAFPKGTLRVLNEIPSNRTGAVAGDPLHRLPENMCADGNYEVTLMTKARVSHTGLVEWQPPAVYKSSCAIDVEFFPYDIQTCVLKLGSWTYDGFKVDLRHMDEKAGSNVVEVGVDLSEFYMSVEWDILEVPAVRNEKFYTCCDEPYLDITFNITMRRKTLFYTVNIIIPCMGISFLTVLTFYLPSDSGEKVTLSISILISLHVFFLLVVEIIPPTSLVVPLLGKYLIFAMILVSISICVTVVVLNVHFRSPQTHRMAPWVKRVFIHILPRLLVMRRPQYHFDPHRFMSRRVIMQTVKGKEIQTSYYPYPYQASAPAENPKMQDMDSIIARQRAISKEDFSPESLVDGEQVFGGSCQIHGPPPQSESEELSLSGIEGGVNDGEDLKSPTIKNPAFSHSMCPPEVHKSCFCVRFIAEHTKMLEDSTKVKEDWKYVAMVLDRLFLWIFTLAVLVGTAGIILQAPTLYDDRIPIDKQFAEIQTSTVIRCPPQ